MDSHDKDRLSASKRGVEKGCAAGCVRVCPGGGNPLIDSPAAIFAAGRCGLSGAWVERFQLSLFGEMLAPV